MSPAARASTTHGYRWRRSVVKEEDQVEAAALHAPEGVALRRARHVGRRSLQPQEARELIFQDELSRLLGAESLAQVDEESLGDLLANQHARPETVFTRSLDLEFVEIQRAADCLRET